MSQAARTVALLALALGAATAYPAAPAGETLEWSLVTGRSGDAATRAVNGAASEGWRVAAVVVDAFEPMVLMTRAGAAPAATAPRYRVVARRGAEEVDEIAEPHVLVAFGADHTGSAQAVFEPASDGTLHRSAQGDAAGELAGEVERLAAEGARCVGAAGRASTQQDWLIFARGTTPREARLVVSEDAVALGKTFDTLAAEGYAVDCAWSRSPGRLSTGAPKQLAAVLSRARGVAASAPLTYLTVGTPPRRGELVAVMPFRDGTAYVARESAAGLRTRDIAWPAETEKHAWGARGEAERRMKGLFLAPASAAWMEYERGQPTRLAIVERSARPAPAPTPPAP